MHFTAVLIPPQEGEFEALNPETGTTAQGEAFPEVLYGKPLPTTFEMPVRAAWPASHIRVTLPSELKQA